MSNWLKTIFADESQNFVSNPTPHLDEKIQIKFRVAKNAPIKKAFLVCWPCGEVTMHKMTKAESMGNFDYYGTNITMTHYIFDYRFLILYDETFAFFTPKGLFNVEPVDFYSFHLVADSDYSDWPVDAVFYQIFPDRFARERKTLVDDRKFEFDLPDKHVDFDRQLSDWNVPVFNDRHTQVMQFYGGNFSGVTSKMSYLADLGITAIYFTPIFKARSNHRYDIEDYTQADPLLGTEDELIEMIETAHANGIKIIFDGVLNHTGLYHKWFDYLDENGGGAFRNENSPYRDYYYFHEDGTYDSWFDCKTLPQLNHQNDDLLAKLISNEDSAIKKWLAPPFKIDGWRLDTAHILGRFYPRTTDEQFNKTLHSAIKSLNQNAYIMGETFYDPCQLVASDKYEATMNYRGFMQPVKMWLTGKMNFITDPQGDEDNDIVFSAERMLSQMDAIRSSLPFQNQIRMYNLLNSHDTPRFLTLLDGNINKLKIALAILFTYIGVPSLYYGDEIGMEGGPDPDCRRPMIWDKSKQNAEINTIYRNLIQLRRQNTTLQRGSFMILHSDDNSLCFARMLGSDYCLTLCNNSDKENVLCLDMSRLCENATVFDRYDFASQNVLNSEKFTVQGNLLNITLRPFDSVILISQKI